MKDKMLEEDSRLDYYRFKQLACAVLHLALDDALKINKINHKENKKHFKKNQREAIFFLTSDSKDVKKVRDFWCAVADVNPDKLKKSYLKHSKDLQAYKLLSAKSKNRERVVCSK